MCRAVTFHVLPLSLPCLFFSCTPVFHLLIIPCVFKPVFFPLLCQFICFHTWVLFLLCSLFSCFLPCVPACVPRASLACTFSFCIFVPLPATLNFCRLLVLFFGWFKLTSMDPANSADDWGLLHFWKKRSWWFDSLDCKYRLVLYNLMEDWKHNMTFLTYFHMCPFLTLFSVFHPSFNSHLPWFVAAKIMFVMCVTFGVQLCADIRSVFVLL